MAAGAWLRSELESWVLACRTYPAVVSAKVVLFVAALLWVLVLSGPRFDPLLDGGDGFIGRTAMSATLPLLYFPNQRPLRQMLARFALYILICASGWLLCYGLAVLANGDAKDKMNAGMAGGFMSMSAIGWWVVFHEMDARPTNFHDEDEQEAQTGAVSPPGDTTS